VIAVSGVVLGALVMLWLRSHLFGEARAPHAAAHRSQRARSREGDESSSRWSSRFSRSACSRANRRQDGGSAAREFQAADDR